MKADTGNYDANIAKARRQLDGFAKDNLSAGGAMKQLTQSALGAAAKFASFGAAIAGAMKVAKDAFMSNEQQLDEWNRAIESSKSVYNGFLDALNSGDMGGFFQNIDDIVAAARRAYDALDELQTFNAFNQRNVARTHREMTEALVAVREGTGTKEQAKAAANAYKEQLRERQSLESQAYKEYVNKLAQERGVSGKDLMKAMSGTYGNYMDLKSKPLSGKRTTVTGSALWGGLQSTTESYAVNETERLGEALRRLNDTELKQLQELGAQADRTGDEIAQVDRTLMRYMGRGGSGSTTGRGGGRGSSGFSSSIKEPALLTAAFEGSIPSMQELRKELAAFKQAADSATTSYERINAESGAARVEQQIAAQPLALKAGIDIDTAMAVQEQWEGGLREQIEEALNADALRLKASLEIDPDQLKEVTTDAKKMGDNWQAAGQAIQAVGSAMSAIEDPAAKVAGTIAEAIASIAMGAGQAIASHGGRMENGGPWGWIAFAASATATMIATIASVRKATSHADGGIIPGNNLSGDNRLAWVNSQELVLNAAQSDTLAAKLQGSDGDYQPRNSYISGEQIVTVVNAYGRRTGRGEILR